MTTRSEKAPGSVNAGQIFQQLLKQAVEAHEAVAAGESPLGPLGIVQLDHGHPLDTESPELLAGIARILNQRTGELIEHLDVGAISEPLAFHRGRLLETVGAYIEARIEKVERSTGAKISDVPQYLEYSGLDPYAARPAASRGKKFPDIGHGLNGQRFGRLTILGRIGTANRKLVALCRCDCGTHSLTRMQDIAAGNVSSCGCYHRERNSEAHTVHGSYGTRLYRVWTAMRSRCMNPEHQNFADYGGRGITVCPEWDSFGAFREWALAGGYKDHLTIDRIDNDGPYSPENCRWATRAEQARNTRRNIHVTLNGEAMTLKDAARATGIGYATLCQRYHTNGEQGLFRPVQRRQIKKQETPTPKG